MRWCICPWGPQSQQVYDVVLADNDLPKEILSLVSFMTPKAWLWQLNCQEPVTNYLSPITGELQGMHKNSSPLNNPHPFNPMAFSSCFQPYHVIEKNRKSRKINPNFEKASLFPTSHAKFINKLLIGQEVVMNLVDCSEAFPTWPLLPFLMTKSFLVLLPSLWTYLLMFHSNLASHPPGSAKIFQINMLAFLFILCKKKE